MTHQKRIKVIGIMSGSSLDGLDLAYVEFTKSEETWTFQLQNTSSVDFPNDFEKSFAKIREIDPEELFALDASFGKWIAENVNELIEKNGTKPDLISSHGHTAFHNPAQGYSIQIGNGQYIANGTGLPAITDFRSKDISKGGQGAPLVPIGDIHLFEKYDGYLNLGGIANMTVKNTPEVLAWDIAPCNQLLNHFARQLGHPFDDKGKLARAGDFDRDFFETLKKIEYFNSSPPKSISNEWVKSQFLDDKSRIPSDGIHTYTRFLADTIITEFESHLDTLNNAVLVTGGGAKNEFLMELLNKSDKINFELPAEEIIDFKEALVFAFLGALRWLGEKNVLGSVTGATSDSTAGTIYLP